MERSRASFTREKLARCLHYFARLYHDLLSLPSEVREGKGLEDMREAEALTYNVEEYCMIPMNEIRKHLEEVHKSILEEDYSRAYYEARYALDDLIEWLRKEGRFS